MQPVAHAAARRSLIVIAAGTALLLVGLWLAHQGGLAPANADAFVYALALLVASLPFVAAQWIAAAGLGWLIRRAMRLDGPGSLITQLGAGLACLLLLDAALGLAGLLNAFTTWGLCILAIPALIWQAYHPHSTPPTDDGPPSSLPWSLAAAAPATGVLLVACLCPVGSLWRMEALGYDVLSYHLQLPREWLERGRIVGLPHNVYSYLPNLVEAGYMAIGAMAGSMVHGLYAAQLFHASAALFVAVAAVSALRHPLRALGRRAGADAPTSSAAALAGSLLLAMPWTLVVGSLAYDEMFGLALGAAALTLVYAPAGRSLRAAALAGLLVGAATLCKLPMGPMIALPVGLILLLGLNRPSANATSAPANADPSPPPATSHHAATTPRTRGPIALAFVAAIAGSLTLTPYFVRNALWTGNPVFPFAARALGHAHWTEFEVNRWDRAHGRAPHNDTALESLDRQWLRSAGYGAVGGRPASTTGIDRFNIARFPRDAGFPLIWVAAAAGAVVSLLSPGLRRIASAMLLMLACQIAFWLLATHQQSRFLVPSLLPQVALVGLLLGWLAHHSSRATRPPARSPLRAMAAPALGVALVGAMTAQSLELLGKQTLLDLPVWTLAGAMPMPEQLDRLGPDANVLGNHPLNHLPPDSLTYSLADNARLLLIRRRLLYETAFDRCLLGDLMRQHRGNPAAITTALRARGVTHVWVCWAEIHRLQSTYGFDPDVTNPAVDQLAKHWRVVLDGPPNFTLYALPR